MVVIEWYAQNNSYTLLMHRKIRKNIYQTANWLFLRDGIEEILPPLLHISSTH